MAKLATIEGAKQPPPGIVEESRGATICVGLFLVLLAIGLAYALLAVWPSSTVELGRTVWLGLSEAVGLKIAAICGAIGSFVHVATSFASFAGNRTLRRSWVSWFLLRPTIAAALALVAYFVMRSDLLFAFPLGLEVSPFGIAALAGIVGLFSKQATDFVAVVCNTAFNSGNDAERAHKL